MASAIRLRHDWFAILVALGLALGGPACDWFKDSTSPTETSTDTFSGTLAPQGSNVFTFTVAKTGPVSVTLTSVAPAATTVVGLGIGTLSGTTCTVTTSNATATAGATPQIVVTENPGSYCLRVYDSSTLAAAVTFSVKVQHS